MEKKRVVITSMGVISSLGFTPENIMDNILKNSVKFENLKFQKIEQICSPIKKFNLSDFTGRYKNRRYLNRGTQFSVASAMEAVKQSGLNEKDLAKAGLFTGAGPNLAIDDEIDNIQKNKMKTEKLPALWILRFLPNTASSAIASLTGIHNENNTISTACASSLQAVGEAYRKIHHGCLNLAFAGGGDSRLSHGGITAYKKAQALFNSGDDIPAKSYAPFNEDCNGFVPGEGGAFFLLEELEHALKRGARIFCEVAGTGTSIDGYMMTAPEPEGKFAQIAVNTALKNAGVSADSVDLISSHGTGTPLNDAMESTLIKRVFGINNPPVIALKSLVGHIAAACGAVELAIVLACLSNDYFPGIRNLTRPCNPDINFLTKGKSIKPETILLENFGFGGQNCALLIKKWKN